eukprot:gene4845-879_t
MCQLAAPGYHKLQVDSFFEGLSSQPPRQEDMLHYGTPWGGLYEFTSQSALASGAPFNKSDLATDPATRMWHELATEGTFSEETLSRTPLNFEVGIEWYSMLVESRKKNDTWLHKLLLGTIALERGNKNASQDMFLSSLAQHPTVHAARNLAVMSAETEATLAYYTQDCLQTQAWSLWQSMSQTDPARARLGINLANEFCIWLAVSNRWDELSALLSDMRSSCQACLEQDRVLDSRASLAVHLGDYTEALTIISTHCFPTYGGERSRLLALWWEAHKQMAAAKAGRDLTNMELVHLRRKIGCDGDSHTMNINQPCIRGPPNIGYAY